VERTVRGSKMATSRITTVIITEAKYCESLNFHSRGEMKCLGILSQVGLLPIHIEASQSTTFSTDHALRLHIPKTGAEPHPSFFKRQSDVEQWQFAGLICWHPDVLRSRLSIANIFAFRAKFVVLSQASRKRRRFCSSSLERE